MENKEFMKKLFKSKFETLDDLMDEIDYGNTFDDAIVAFEQLGHIVSEVLSLMNEAKQHLEEEDLLDLL